MSISIVNGYLCTSSCDAAKARTGQDPHPRNDAGRAQDATPNSTRTPAVTYGGALAERNAIAPVTEPAPSAATNSRPAAAIDISV